MSLIKKLPIAFAGTALGLVALGNLLQTYSLGKTVRPIFAIIAGAIILAIIAKFILFKEEFLKELDNPVVFSSFVTFFMTFTILSTYLPQGMGKLFWFFGIIGHLIYLLAFTSKYLLSLKMPTVFPSWYIVFVGFVTGSVAAPKVQLFGFGKILFWVGLILYLILLFLVTYRMIKFKEMPEPAKATKAVYAAPASLLLAGYVSSFAPSNEINLFILYFLLCLSIVFYIYGIYIASNMVFKKFFPSFSSFTFPFVISAIAAKMSSSYLGKIGKGIPILKTLLPIQEILALIFVLYVLYLYINYLIKD